MSVKELQTTGECLGLVHHLYGEKGLETYFQHAKHYTREHLEKGIKQLRKSRLDAVADICMQYLEGLATEAELTLCPWDLEYNELPGACNRLRGLGTCNCLGNRASRMRSQKRSNRLKGCSRL
jgi:hypothetical protein